MYGPWVCLKSRDPPRSLKSVGPQLWIVSFHWVNWKSRKIEGTHSSRWTFRWIKESWMSGMCSITKDQPLTINFNMLHRHLQWYKADQKGTRCSNSLVSWFVFTQNKGTVQQPPKKNSLKTFILSFWGSQTCALRNTKRNYIDLYRTRKQ